MDGAQPADPGAPSRQPDPGDGRAAPEWRHDRDGSAPGGGTFDTLS
jgi:hypothetical protein